jgi:hypothetical protein
MARRAIEADQWHPVVDQRGANRPALRRTRLDDEAEALVADTGTRRQLVGEHDRQHAPNRIRNADRRLGADRSVLEVRGDVVLRQAGRAGGDGAGQQQRRGDERHGAASRTERRPWRRHG